MNNEDPKSEEPLGPDRPLPANPSLEFYEALIERGIPDLASSASALLAIHEHKLYRKKYPSFKVYLEQRWRCSRSRGYQILHLARLMRMSTMVDTLGTINERQARLLDGAGKLRNGPNPDLVQQAMAYLARMFFRLQVSDRPEFIDAIRKLISDMEKSLNEAKKTA